MMAFEKLDLKSLEDILGVSFKNHRLLEEALIHPSFLNENPSHSIRSNQRLEFLGDAVLNLVVASAIFEIRPKDNEGILTRLRSFATQGHTLAQISRDLNLGNFLILGRGEESSGGRSRESNLTDLYEALIGALFLDQGYPAARRLVMRTLEHIITKDAPLEAKSHLQETIQAWGWPIPQYELLQTAGPPHQRRFVVEVKSGTQILGHGEGPNKGTAERAAAEEALGFLETLSDRS